MSWFRNLWKLGTKFLFIKNINFLFAANFLSLVYYWSKVVNRAKYSINSPDGEACRAHPSKNLWVDITISNDSPEGSKEWINFLCLIFCLNFSEVHSHCSSLGTDKSCIFNRILLSRIVKKWFDKAISSSTRYKTDWSWSHHLNLVLSAVQSVDDFVN